MKYQSLIARLEGGETGREIDAEIMFDLFAKPIAMANGGKAYLWPEDDPAWSFGLWCDPERRERICKTRKGQETLLIERDGGLVLMNSLRVPHLTTSLDAAVALLERVRPGAKWAWMGNKAFLFDSDDDGSQLAAVRAPTPAAALVAALLRARTPDSQ